MTALRTVTLDLRNAFQERGVSAPELAAREIVCAGLGISKTGLAAQGERGVSGEMLSGLWDMARRHIEGEPLAYILGQWDFYGLSLAVTPDVLIPRPDTETLARLAIETLERTKNPRVLDLCCGSGCVGLAVAANVPCAGVTLADICPKALQIAGRNAGALGIKARCIEADALTPPPPDFGRFDSIVCNPPYISDADYQALDIGVRGYEPAPALRGGADGLDFYRAITLNWRDALKPGGAMLFEVGLGQAAAVAGMMRDGGYGNVSIQRDLSGIERVVTGHNDPSINIR